MKMIESGEASIASSRIKESVCIKTVKRKRKNIVHGDKNPCTAFPRNAQRIVGEIMMNVVCVNNVRSQMSDFFLDHG